MTGATALQIDVSDRLGAALLPFGLVVMGLSLLLLMVVFRSIWVPVKATLGFLLSVLAAFGTIGAVYGWGWGADLLNATTGPVISFLPIILMGVLFGLAMDYEVFLVSRMREDFVHTGDAKGSVRTGFASSARVVTAAAVIMIAVFAAFIPSGDTIIQPIALGLAVGVFVDAFLVRMTLVPAVMTLLGQRAWWLPRWLDRLLPSLDIEGEALAHHLRHEEWVERHGPAAVRAAGLTVLDEQGRAGGRGRAPHGGTRHGARRWPRRTSSPAARCWRPWPDGSVPQAVTSWSSTGCCPTRPVPCWPAPRSCTTTAARRSWCSTAPSTPTPHATRSRPAARS